MTMRGCEPLLGHYWTTAEPVPDSAGSLLPEFLTPSPPTRIMTKRGLMDVTPGFFYASYKLVVRASCPYCYSEKSLTARSFLAISIGRWRGQLIVATDAALPSRGVRCDTPRVHADGERTHQLTLGPIVGGRVLSVVVRVGSWARGLVGSGRRNACGLEYVGRRNSIVEGMACGMAFRGSALSTREGETVAVSGVCVVC